MHPPDRPNNLALLHRRHLMQSVLLVPLSAHAAAQPAGGRTATPAQSLGPFYPRDASERPAQTDNDLLVLQGDRVLTRGTPLYLTGRVVALAGPPLAAARVEIWQCDAHAVYHHPAGGAPHERDPHFQGYGSTQTDAEGVFHFRTIRPVPYPGRTPHIHVRVATAGSARTLGTQLYLADEPGNARDFLFRQLSAQQREAVSLRLRPTESTHPLARGTTATGAVELVVA
jgi:protocatechuate 3,4-dioxygenase beta subunit